MPYKEKGTQNEYQRKWIAERKALWFRDKCCRNCGNKKHLELDHIDPNKKWTHRIWSYSWAKIMAEVAKCQVLCHSCHVEKTMRENGWLTEDDIPKKMRVYMEMCMCRECESIETESIKDFHMRRKKVDPAKRLLTNVM